VTAASAEALQLLDLVADAGKYSERLRELVSKTEAADKATQALQVAEAASSKRLAAAEALLQSLTSQADAITAANAEAAAQIEAAKGDLAHRASQLESARQQHADQVRAQLQTFAAREAESAARQSVLDTDFHRRLEDLRGVENKLRDHHGVLRDIVTETRARIAAAS
jgi:chromosome segregation ATPase